MKTDLDGSLSAERIVTELAGIHRDRSILFMRQ